VPAEHRTAAIPDKSKVYALLSRHPAGLTPHQLALACLSQGLAVGEPATVVEHLMHILMDLEAGPVHRKVVKTDDGRYRVVPFW
jgi:hypothetical protein